MARRIEQYKDNALRPILDSVVESLDNWGISIEDLIDDYESDFINIHNIIEKELESFGLDHEFEDITYMLSILVNNPNFQTEPIERPKLQSYDVYHTYERRVTVEDTYLNTYDSYIELTKDILIDMQSEQLYEPDEGEKIKSEITDEDYLNDWVDSIQ
jgi:hypothetical protein